MLQSTCEKITSNGHHGDSYLPFALLDICLRPLRFPKSKSRSSAVHSNPGKKQGCEGGNAKVATTFAVRVACIRLHVWLFAEHASAIWWSALFDLVSKLLLYSLINSYVRPSSMNENEKWKRGFRGFRGFNRNASTARVLWRLKAKKKWNQLYPIVSILKEWNCRNAWDATNEASDKPGLDTQS